MKITFPYWGNYTIAFKALFKALGVDFIAPEKTSSASIEEGAKLSPSMYCFPLKVNMGNYLSAIRKGADTIFMVTSLSGSCRLRYYAAVEDKSLLEAGHNIKFVIFNQSLKDVYLKIKNLSHASNGRILLAALIFFKKLRLVEKLEKRAQYIRPREKVKGSVDEILKTGLEKLDEADGLREIAKVEKEIDKKISQIGIDRNKKVPQVGFIGEIFTVTDNMINFEIEKKLGQEGIEIHRVMDVTYHLKKILFPWKDYIIQQKIRPYLKSTVGGHGRDAIYEMLDYMERDFDGIVHLLPFGCMPETTVRPILEKIRQKTRMPFLSISLDEQVAEAGIGTRIEAFVDVVKNYYSKKPGQS
ncbi:MAG: acyl-CoA dehydratase activase-related protein [bacterium]